MADLKKQAKALADSAKASVGRKLSSASSKVSEKMHEKGESAKTKTKEAASDIKALGKAKLAKFMK